MSTTTEEGDFESGSSLSLSGLDSTRGPGVGRALTSSAGGGRFPSEHSEISLSNSHLQPPTLYSPAPHANNSSMRDTTIGSLMGGSDAPLSVSGTHVGDHALPATPSYSSGESTGSIGRPLPSASPITPSTRIHEDEEDDDKEMEAPPADTRAKRNLILDSDSLPALPDLTKKSAATAGGSSFLTANTLDKLYDSASVTSSVLQREAFGSVSVVGAGAVGDSTVISDAPLQSHVPYGLSAIRAISSLELRTDSEGEEMHKRVYMGAGAGGTYFPGGSERESTQSVMNAIERELHMEGDSPLHPVESVQMAIRTLARSRGGTSSPSVKDSSSSDAFSPLPPSTSKPSPLQPPAASASPYIAGDRSASSLMLQDSQNQSSLWNQSLQAASLSPSRIPKPKPKSINTSQATDRSNASTTRSTTSSMAQKARGLREKLGRAPAAVTAAKPTATAVTAAKPAATAVRPPSAPPKMRKGAAGATGGDAHVNRSSAGGKDSAASSTRLSSMGDLSSLAGELHELQSKLNSMQGQLARASVDASLSRTIKDADAARELARGLASSIESLRSRLDHETASRASLVGELTHLKDAHREETKRMKESWEARLREKQREIIALTKRVQELESTTYEAKARIMAAPTSGPAATVTLTADELKQIRAEIAEQETLLRGYQQENQAAMAKLKEQKQEGGKREEELLAIVQRLERQVREAQDEARRAHIPESKGRLEEVLKMQKDLEGMREEHETEALQYKAEIERLKLQLQESEARNAALDQEKSGAEASVVRQLQHELSVTREQSRAVVESLERRLRAQEAATHALEGQGGLIRDQAATIQVLEARLRQVSSAEVVAKQVALEQEVAQWRDKYEQAEKEFQSREKSVRLQYDKRVTDLENRLSHLSQLDKQRKRKEETQRHENNNEAGSPRAKDNSEDGASPVDSSSSPPPLHLTPSPSTSQPSRTTSALLLAKREHRIRELEGHVGARDREIAALHQRIAVVESELRTARAATTQAPTIAPSTEVQALQRRVEELSVTCEDLQRKLAAASQAQAQAEPPSALQRRAEAAELALQSMQRAHSDAVERLVALQSEHQRHMERMSEDTAMRIVEIRARTEAETAAKTRAQVEDLETQLRNASEGLRVAEREVATLRAVRDGWRPEARDYAELERRISHMEEEQRGKEAKWKQVVEEARRVHGLQQTLLRQKMELALEAKNREIERFRGELDAILDAAVHVQQAQQRTIAVPVPVQHTVAIVPAAAEAH